MSKRIMQVLALLFLICSAGVLSAEDATGRWWTQGRDSLVLISTDSSGRLIGKIVQGPKPEELDARNPDPALRRRPLLGLAILEGFVRESPTRWTSGQIYDPDNGKTYKAILWLDPRDPGHLNLKGYVGITLFGRTTVWTRDTAPR